jgi:hypothetical protein
LPVTSFVLIFADRYILALSYALTFKTLTHNTKVMDGENDAPAVLDSLSPEQKHQQLKDFRKCSTPSRLARSLSLTMRASQVCELSPRPFQTKIQ